MNEDLIAPYLSGLAGAEYRWAGTTRTPPWDRQVTATFAHLETPDVVPYVVELLRLQSVSPYILIVDTGSSRRTCDKLERNRADDVEIHYIRSHAYLHSSSPVAVACDLAQALCCSEYLFWTHSDCFMRNRYYVEERLEQCDENTPVVGYQMSPRDWMTDQWRGMVSHTATLTHMPTWHSLGITWSFQRAFTAIGLPFSTMGWPDTETSMNLQLRAHGIKPLLIGDETNFERHLDDNLDHCRSYPGSKLYSPDHYKLSQGWIDVAVAEARERIDDWRRRVA